MSFRRERVLPRGGPDGGDGGDGGDLYVVARKNLNTFEHIGGRRVFPAGRGQPGSSRKCHGRNGEDFVLELPVGSIVKDAERDNVLVELTEPDKPVRVLKGGRGGRGNFSYRSSVQRAPRRFQPGGEAEERRVRLELKLLADVGLVGLPNAGKSTLLAAISHAQPKVGIYPFTTLKPRVGTVLKDFQTLTVADLPGLLEGAHEGRGLGARFLRHIERTRVVAHLLDASEASPDQLVETYRVVRDELVSFSRDLAIKPEVVLLTKLDLRDGAIPVEEMSERLQRPVLPISSLGAKGLQRLVRDLFELSGRSS